MADPAAPNSSPRAGLAIEMAGVSKWFGQFQVLKNIDLAVKRGEKIVICGPSGSGK
jgi:ABC-type polar amino acid transport system ATPase subunit